MAGTTKQKLPMTIVLLITIHCNNTHQRDKSKAGTLKMSKKADPIQYTFVQCESKNPPYGFLDFFPNGWEFLTDFLRSFLH